MANQIDKTKRFFSKNKMKRSRIPKDCKNVQETSTSVIETLLIQLPSSILSYCMSYHSCLDFAQLAITCSTLYKVSCLLSSSPSMVIYDFAKMKGVVPLSLSRMRPTSLVCRNVAIISDVAKLIMSLYGVVLKQTNKDGPIETKKQGDNADKADKEEEEPEEWHQRMNNLKSIDIGLISNNGHAETVYIDSAFEREFTIILKSSLCHLTIGPTLSHHLMFIFMKDCINIASFPRLQSLCLESFTNLSAPMLQILLWGIPLLTKLEISVEYPLKNDERVPDFDFLNVLCEYGSKLTTLKLLLPLTSTQFRRLGLHMPCLVSLSIDSIYYEQVYEEKARKNTMEPLGEKEKVQGELYREHKDGNEHKEVVSIVKPIVKPIPFPMLKILSQTRQRHMYNDSLGLVSYDLPRLVELNLGQTEQSSFSNLASLSTLRSLQFQLVDFDPDVDTNTQPSLNQGMITSISTHLTQLTRLSMSCYSTVEPIDLRPLMSLIHLSELCICARVSINRLPVPLPLLSRLDILTTSFPDTSIFYNDTVFLGTLYPKLRRVCVNLSN